MTKNPQYYFDTLPLHSQPEHLESFTSYLSRLSEMNGINSISALASICFPDYTLVQLQESSYAKRKKTYLLQY